MNGQIDVGLGAVISIPSDGFDPNEHSLLALFLGF
jgi:hypothetical protein